MKITGSVVARFIGMVGCSSITGYLQIHNGWRVAMMAFTVGICGCLYGAADR